MEDTLKEGSKELGVQLDEEQIDKLIKYKEILVDWNEKINLTAITDDFGIATKHFLDSLTPILTNKVKGKVIDVGTGAGFPGLVLKVKKPEIELTLLDSLNKRINFLNEVIKELNLENIEAIHARMEEYARININKFDVVTARAVAQMHFLLEVAIPMLKINKYFIAMKGNIDNEINYQYALNKLNSKEERIEIFKLPIEKSNRTLIKIKKIKETSKIFPRKYKEIKIKPLF